MIPLKIRGLLAVTIGIALGLSLSLGAGVLAEREPATEPLPWQQARLLAEVMERVRREYVEPVDDRRLIESAVRGMMKELDPHSRFLGSTEYEEVRINTSGSYSGIGLEVHREDGQIVVVAPLEGTPAERAGIRSGDVIIAVDGQPVTEELGDTIRRMRGRTGSRVALTVERDGERGPLDFQLTRSNVRIQSVRGELLEDRIGYIRIAHFNETTARELQREVTRLRRQAGDGLLDGLVLDLRNNPGGVLEAGIDVADAFLDRGLIVTASGRTREANFRHTARPGDLLDGARMIVLVNGGSASAAEIVAGALRDNQRATVVGTTTFGKGSVQTVMPLSDGRAIKLTTSRYFTPGGHSIQDRGVEPDIVHVADDFTDALVRTTRHDRDPARALAEGDGQIRLALDLLANRQQTEKLMQSRLGAEDASPGR